MRPIENDDIASFPFGRRHTTPQGSVERHPGKAYIRMGIVLETVKGRDLSERLLPRQRGGDHGAARRCVIDLSGSRVGYRFALLVVFAAHLHSADSKPMSQGVDTGHGDRLHGVDGDGPRVARGDARQTQAVALGQ